MGKKDKGNGAKYAALIIIGVLTMTYSLLEVSAAIYYSSLTLLSDGFHNLSDVISLIIAYWALKKSEQGPTTIMTYGWKRTEILGAVMNGCFLLALCLYTVLEAIPRFVDAKPPDDFNHTDHAHSSLPFSFEWAFIGIAASGLAINLAGTIAFALVGANAHGHSHDGGAHGHGHSHGHHDHDHDEEDEEEESHGHGHDHGHGHKEKKDKKKDNHLLGEEGHGHSHKEKKEKKAKEKGHGHGHEHGHAHGDGDEHEHHVAHEEGHEGHSHHEDDADVEAAHGHSHGHGHKDETKPKAAKTLRAEGSVSFAQPSLNSHGERELLLVTAPKKKKKGKKDHNMQAVFLHYLGDALSSLCVLVSGLLYLFFPYAKHNWVKYLDPIGSIIIVALILATTIPFVRSAAVILLQGVPSEVSIPHLTEELLRVDGILDVHDLHVWQLVDKMVIASVHVRMVDTDVAHAKVVMARAKAVFHKFGVHSCTMQPEFIAKGYVTGPAPCSLNCVENCAEDWCCKDDADQTQKPATPYGAV